MHRHRRRALLHSGTVVGRQPRGGGHTVSVGERDGRGGGERGRRRGRERGRQGGGRGRERGDVREKGREGGTEGRMREEGTEVYRCTCMTRQIQTLSSTRWDSRSDSISYT